MLPPRVKAAIAVALLLLLSACQEDGSIANLGPKRSDDWLYGRPAVTRDDSNAVERARENGSLGPRLTQSLGPAGIELSAGDQVEVTVVGNGCATAGDTMRVFGAFNGIVALDACNFATSGQSAYFGTATHTDTLRFELMDPIFGSGSFRIEGSFPLYTVYMEDGYGDGDFNDNILEVRIVNRNALQVTCEPSPVVRRQQVDCTATLPDHRPFTLRAVVATRAGRYWNEVFLDGFNTVDGGKTWSLKGMALFTTTLKFSGDAPASDPNNPIGIDDVSGEGRFSVLEDPTFAAMDFGAGSVLVDELFPAGRPVEDFRDILPDYSLGWNLWLGLTEAPSADPADFVNGSATFQAYLTTGPNRGFYYFIRLPRLRPPISHINPGFSRPDLYRWTLDQNGLGGYPDDPKTIAPNGYRYCTGADLAAIENQVRDHEYRDPVNSHVAIYRGQLHTSGIGRHFDQWVRDGGSDGNDWQSTQGLQSVNTELIEWRLAVSGAHLALDNGPYGSAAILTRVGCQVDYDPQDQ